MEELRIILKWGSLAILIVMAWIMAKSKEDNYFGKTEWVVVIIIVGLFITWWKIF